EGRFPEARARVEEGVRRHLWAPVRVLASLRHPGGARDPQLPEEQPGRPRASLSRAVPRGRSRRGEARELRGGGALVPRLPLLVPERGRIARHRLPARRPPAREQELPPCRARVRTNRVRIIRSTEGS